MIGRSSGESLETFWNGRPEDLPNGAKKLSKIKMYIILFG